MIRQTWDGCSAEENYLAYSWLHLRFNVRKAKPKTASYGLPLHAHRQAATIAGAVFSFFLQIALPKRSRRQLV